MSTFDEYAALARHLAAQQRAEEQGAAAEAERRRDLSTAVEYLERRLTAQGQRLGQLGRAIGIPPAPPGQPGTMPAPGAPPTTTGTGRHAPAGGEPAATGPDGQPGPAQWPHAAAPPGAHAGSASGTVEVGGAAAAPGWPGVGAYPQENQPGRAVAVSAGTAGVPAQRAVAGDPATELELARRWADEADRYGQQAELYAQQPALLPSWSAMARALAVYGACAAAGVVLMVLMVFASGVGVVDGFTLYAWMCAGLPAFSMIAGWLVLNRWGRPPVGAVTPPRYPVLGFLVCFLAVPLAYCAYLLLFRTLR